MPKFAANLTMLFNEVPFLDRFERAHHAGFQAVEFLFPYAYSATEIRQLLDQYKLNLVLHNLPAGNWDSGERGIACLPDRKQEFRESVSMAIEYAKALKVKQLNCLAGKVPVDANHKELHQTFVENLSYAAAEFENANLNLLIEPINTFDIPGFFLNTAKQANEILAEVGAKNLYIQYDIYHAQRMEGELAATIEKYFAKIAHIQIADNPGRNEPGTGEINYSFLFKLLDRLGYEGWIGCEYKPANTTEAGLGWIDQIQ